MFILTMIILVIDITPPKTQFSSGLPIIEIMYTWLFKL